MYWIVVLSKTIIQFVEVFVFQSHVFFEFVFSFESGGAVWASELRLLATFKFAVPIQVRLVFVSSATFTDVLPRDVVEICIYKSNMSLVR